MREDPEGPRGTRDPHPGVPLVRPGEPAQPRVRQGVRPRGAALVVLVWAPAPGRPLQGAPASCPTPGAPSPRRALGRPLGAGMVVTATAAGDPGRWWRPEGGPGPEGQGWRGKCSGKSRGPGGHCWGLAGTGGGPRPAPAQQAGRQGTALSPWGHHGDLVSSLSSQRRLVPSGLVPQPPPASPVLSLGGLEAPGLPGSAGG